MSFHPVRESFAVRAPQRPSRPVVAVVLLAVGLGASACGPAADAVVPAERVLGVTARSVAASDHYLVERSYTGQLEPRREARAGFDLAGTLVRSHADEGDRVDAGEVLAELDTARLEARRRELQAAVEEADTALRLSASTRRRVERAAAGKAISELEVDEAREAEESAAARLARAEAQLELIEVELRKSVLRAPFRAVVARRLADEGHVLGAGAPLFELLEIDRPRVRLGVPPEVARELAAEGSGEPLEVRVAGRGIEAFPLAVLPAQNERTRTVDVLLELEHPLDGLRSGETATLRLRRRIESAGFWLPLGALAESARGLWSCYVAVPLDSGAPPREGGATHRLELRPLEVLEIAAGEADGSAPGAYVRGALESGDLVVIEGLQRLVSGQRVRLAAAPQTSTETPLTGDAAAPTEATGS